MQKRKYLVGMRRLAAVSVMGAFLASPFSSCAQTEFTTTSTTTLSAQDALTFLVQSWLITPLNNLIAEKINGFFGTTE